MTYFISSCQVSANRRSIAQRFCCGVFAMTILVGCTVGPKYHAPAPPSLSTYTPKPQPSVTAGSTVSTGSQQHLNPAMDVPAQW